jgi:hypothetical protein
VNWGWFHLRSAALRRYEEIIESPEHYGFLGHYPVE